jgi:hypothetical protein
MNFTLITKFHGQKVQRVSTHSIHRFYRRLRTISWQDDTSCYLCVSNGKDYDVFGQYRTFYNDGEYTNRKDLFQAFKAFTEL